MPLLQEGQTVNQRWIVERHLGDGAFAEVYRVRHKIFGRQAMKIFKRVGMKIEEVEEILQEPILLAGINHPNIIRVYDADTNETSKGLCCFFTMEYIAGGTLERFWKSYKDEYVPVLTTIEIIRQAVAGLAAAHSAHPPIIHRDIKPQNILIGYDDNGLRVRIADFGLAKKFNILTMALTGLGTRCFKPPEVMINLKADSAAGDVWALGTCLYLLLTDRFPFSDDFDFESLQNSRFEQPLRAPSYYNNNVDETLDSIVYKCLALNVKDRFQNAVELQTALSNWTPRKRYRKKQSVEKSQFPSSEKKAIGLASTLDRDKAMQLSKEAVQLSYYVNRLTEAADMMEEAFNKWPKLREKYEFKVVLWRKGISG